MRVELQLSYTFLADYIAGKITATIAAALPIGFPLPAATLLDYAPQTPPTIDNQAPGVVRASLKFGPFLPVLELDLAASIAMSKVQITATLANHDAVVMAIKQAAPTFDTSQIPSQIPAPFDLSALLAVGGASPSSIPAPTQAGFAADAANQIVALRIEVGPASASDSAAWTQFLNNHAFSPVFHPADVTENPPRHWAAAIDWQALQPVFAAEIEPVVKQNLLQADSTASVTGDFLFAWGLKNGDQPAGFADSWPLANSSTVDLDLTCPIHVQGYDGHLYVQMAFSSASRNHMQVDATLKAHVSCKWKDIDPVTLSVPLGGFGFDGNVLLLDNIRTDARGMVLQGAVLFQMPLLFPSPSLDVGTFFWSYANACDPSTEGQMVGVYLSDSTTGGLETAMLSRLKVTAPFPVTIESVPKADSTDVTTGPVAWTLIVSKANVPAGGGKVTIEVETNVGAPVLPAGESLDLTLAPALTQEQELLLSVKNKTACINGKDRPYVPRYIPVPPEEIIWWLTQEMTVAPNVSGITQATLGAVSRVIVAAPEVPEVLRLHRETPNGAIIKQMSTPAGLKTVYRTVVRGRA